MPMKRASFRLQALRLLHLYHGVFQTTLPKQPARLVMGCVGGRLAAKIGELLLISLPAGLPAGDTQFSQRQAIVFEPLL